MEAIGRLAGEGGDLLAGTCAHRQRTADGELGRAVTERGDRRVPSGLKPKDLLLMPARLALALQADGWWVRSDIIWHKPNPMPESVTDRPTSAHEHVFLLAKAERYFFDAEAVKEQSVTNDPRRPYGSQGAWQMDGRPVEQRHGGELRAPANRKRGEFSGKTTAMQFTETRNIRNVWTIATNPYPEAHFATFPPELAERCIKAGSRIAPYSVIGRECHIEEQAVVDQSILWANSWIRQEAVVRGAIIGRHCHIGRNASVADGVVLGDKSVVTDHSRL
jgi:hypothetical protein